MQQQGQLSEQTKMLVVWLIKFGRHQTDSAKATLHSRAVEVFAHSHSLLSQQMPCCHLVGCTGSPVENSNPSKYPIWMSFDWRWEPRAQKSNNHMKRKSSKAEPKSPGGPSSSNTMHSYHSGKLQKKSLPGVEWQTERDSCLKMISLFKTLVNKLQPFNKQTIWWKKESSIVLFHLMSSSLQCRQHSI